MGPTGASGLGLPPGRRPAVRAARMCAVRTVSRFEAEERTQPPVFAAAAAAAAKAGSPAAGQASRSEEGPAG